MKHLIKPVLGAAVILSQTTLAFAHEGMHGHGKSPAHEELSIKLPFDPMFCDVNDNGTVDPDEMNAENICMTEEGNQLFAMKPIASLGLRKGQLALTIDDGPNPAITPQILDLLDAYRIKASFFVVGSLAATHPDIIRDIVRRGHTVGNHTYSHNVKGITSETIVGEVSKAHRALVTALGGEMKGRLLFRAPGLAWSGPKALNLNANNLTRTYIGPIHANLGTDAPRADWACWSKGISAEKCAGWYFQDIVNTGRGIVLSHDIFYKPGRGNTLEMLKILLRRLDTEAGGIKNKNGSGVWEFVSIRDQSVLDQFDNKKIDIPLAKQVTSGDEN